jgi:uncharacterized protein YecT (DUF1311 family)
MERKVKKILGILLLSMVSGSNIAGTAINCYEVKKMKVDTVEVCVDQTDRHLNENYQELIKQFGKSKDQKKLLKTMQQGWIKMRDAQCELNMKNTGSSAGLVGMVCNVILTQKRADELEEMIEGVFASYGEHKEH